MGVCCIYLYNPVVRKHDVVYKNGSTQSFQRTTDPRLQVTCKKIGGIGHVIFEICAQTDMQTPIFCPGGGEVMTKSLVNQFACAYSTGMSPLPGGR